jgi:hypothetical protein
MDSKELAFALIVLDLIVGLVVLTLPGQLNLNLEALR